MRLIKRATLASWTTSTPEASDALLTWERRVRHADWSSIRDVRLLYPSADAVMVTSGKTVTVFNIRGNHFRLIVAIHYRGQRVYLLRFLTHAEYGRDAWKKTL